VVEAAGLIAIYAVLRAAGAGVGSIELLAPMILGGIGMGMVFVPLFDIVLAGVRPHEMGSAASVLQSVNGLGSSIGVAGLGAIFFGIVGTGGSVHFLDAGEWTALLSVGLLALAFVLGFWLPSHAREQELQPEQPIVADAAAPLPLAA
jgi:hypothetical protein